MGSSAGSASNPMPANPAPTDHEEPGVRNKTRRTRIKTRRAKRHRRRFYTYLEGKERARK